ncbi:MAG: CoA transferase [Phenylobacterium sp.]|uniref:CaiB/BaiF CoA transferase family protein n=1 Tax=Phenylobacterium sp. TaxID=1871053 RepID=UPI002735BDE9|nr:CoA transferase [Phenylobacterium sp.]MDP3175754.1 CoA transferase [Phenylobacterium sp.]
MKVVDCASFVAAPGAATLLSDFGADVIKLEPPEGDAYRYAYAPPGKAAPEHNFLWMLGSRNKRSLALDLKVPEGLSVLERLLDGADVFITNLPLLTRRRLKIGFEDLSPGRPRLIYASFTAYGESGAEADRPGFDTTSYWARSGLMDLMRPVDGAPISSSGGMGDNPAAAMLYAAILSGLYRREQTGLGGQVDVSLLAAGLWTNSLQIQANLCGMPSAPRVRRTEGMNACVNTYRCADDRWFNMMVLNEAKLFRPLVAAIGREDLADDPRFAEIAARRANSAALIAIFDERFAAHDLAYWREARTRPASRTRSSPRWTMCARTPRPTPSGRSRHSPTTPTCTPSAAPSMSRARPRPSLGARRSLASTAARSFRRSASMTPRSAT